MSITDIETQRQTHPHWPIQATSAGATVNAQLPWALLSVLFVIGGYFGVAAVLKPLLDGVAIAGYEIQWSVWASSILTLIVLAWARVGRGGLASLGLSRPRSYVRGVLLGAVATVVIYAAIVIPVIVLVSAGLISPPPDDASAMVVSGPSLPLSIGLTLVIMWINAAFGEELLFRGFLMNNLQRALGNGVVSGLAAALVVAVVFGAMHVPSQGAYGFVITGMAGLSLGVLFLVGKRNLFPVVIAHGLINTIGVFAEAAMAT